MILVIVQAQNLGFGGGGGGRLHIYIYISCMYVGRPRTPTLPLMTCHSLWVCGVSGGNSCLAFHVRRRVARWSMVATVKRPAKIDLSNDGTECKAWTIERARVGRVGGLRFLSGVSTKKRPMLFVAALCPWWSGIET